MPINRSLWHRVVSSTAIPSLPCPECSNGKLKLKADGVQMFEPRHAINSRNNDPENYEPSWDTGRWSATFVCDEPPCGEIVNMIGDTEVVETITEDREGYPELIYEDALRIRAVFPAPPLFRLSDNVPVSVRSELLVAFRMLWTDTSACVARLRTAVERMLDQQNVPKERINATGKVSRMNLQQRIDSFAIGAAHKDQLDGLRNIGNLGTHGSNSVDADDLFDALDVLDYVLMGVYDTKTINAKAKRLSNKGKSPGGGTP